MRLLFLMICVYGGLIAYGISHAAGRGGACSDPQCTESQTASEASGIIVPGDSVDVDALETRLQGLLAKIQETIDMKKLESLIQKAAQSNPEVADLLAIIQQYGFFTDISTAPAPEDAATEAPRQE